MSPIDVPGAVVLQPTNVTSGDVLAFDAFEEDCVALVGEGGGYRVYHSRDGGRTWMAPWPDLSGDLLVTALAAASTGVYVGLLTQGVVSAPYAPTDRRSMWRDAAHGLPGGVSVTALAAAGDSVYLGTQRHGLFEHVSGGWQLESTLGGEPITALAAIAGGVLAAGTRRFVRMSGDEVADIYDPCVDAAPSGLQATSAGLLGWTCTRAWVSHDDGVSWIGLPDLPAGGARFRSLTIAGPHAFAGLHGRHDTGILRWTGGESWETHVAISESWSATVYGVAGGLLMGSGSGGILHAPVPTAGAFPQLSFEIEPSVLGHAVRFRLNQPADTRIELSGADGVNLRTMMLGFLAPGTHEVVFDGGILPPGMYSCSITAAGQRRAVRQLILC